MSKFIKRFTSKPKQTVQPEPRTLVEITKEYDDMVAKVGKAQYQAYVFTKEAEFYNQRLLQLNQEANERNKLDAKKTETKEVTNETAT